MQRFREPAGEACNFAEGKSLTAFVRLDPGHGQVPCGTSATRLYTWNYV